MKFMVGCVSILREGFELAVDCFYFTNAQDRGAAIAGDFRVGLDPVGRPENSQLENCRLKNS
jgi:hypothetical protein